MKVTKQESLYHKDHVATFKHKFEKKDSNLTLRACSKRSNSIGNAKEIVSYETVAFCVFGTKESIFTDPSESFCYVHFHGKTNIQRYPIFSGGPAQ